MVRRGGREVDEVTCGIRRAVSADAAELAEFAARTFRDTYEAGANPRDMAAHLARSFGPDQQLAEINAHDIVTLLAVRRGLAGFAQLRLGPAPACVASIRPVELWRLYVDRTWHGQGVAGQLMRATLAEAVAAGASAVWLGVWEFNPRAVAFYRKFGFVDVGTHDFRFGTAVETDRVMVRILAPALNADRHAADRGRHSSA